MKLNPNQKTIDEWSNYDKTEIEQFGDEGDLSRQYILTPTIMELIGEIKDLKILDAGCGTGYLTRKLAKLGAKMSGIEPSKSMHTYCIEREEKEKLEIKYLNDDISTIILKEKFDFVIANMVIQDIFLYEEAISNLISMLEVNGKFIFSILHPLWVYTKYSQSYFENYEIKQKFGYSYHRTIQQYVDVVNSSKGIISRIIEPQPLDIAKDIEEMKTEFQRPTFLFFEVKRNF